MERSFYRSPNLSPEQLGQLLKKDNITSGTHFILLYSVFLGTGIGLVLTRHYSWWLFLPFLLVFSSCIPALFACQHESIHQTAFRNRSLNYWVALLTGTAYAYPPTLFKDFHFAHHQYTHQPGRDPEISLGRWPVPSVIEQFPSYLSWITGLPLLLFRLLMITIGALGTPEPIRRLLLPFLDSKHRFKLFLECWLVLVLHGSIVYLAMTSYPAFWGLIMGQLIGTAFWASYTAAEHNGLPHEGNILEKTRSIKSKAWLRWWMWNMPYHAEHHAYPAVPHHALPTLHQLLEKELIHKEATHASFHRQVLHDTTIGGLKQSK